MELRADILRRLTKEPAEAHGSKWTWLDDGSPLDGDAVSALITDRLVSSRSWRAGHRVLCISWEGNQLLSSLDREDGIA